MADEYDKPNELPPHKVPLDTPLYVPPSEQGCQHPVPKPGEPIPIEAEPEPPKPPEVEAEQPYSWPKV